LRGAVDHRSGQYRDRNHVDNQPEPTSAFHDYIL
jgi:hypothetical protein